MAKAASRRYAELDARARENSKQIGPEQSDPRQSTHDVPAVAVVGRIRAEISVLNRLWRGGGVAVEGVR